MKQKTLPVEVSLVNEVKKCNDCPWFWGGIPPYGPYPAIDWKGLLPKGLCCSQPSSSETTPVKWTEADAVGDRLPEPAVLKGCRKAPIMTLGINPNLGAYFAGPGGAVRCYPSFARAANYAYYYRHASVFQECLDEGTIHSWIVEGTELKARSDGWLVAVERGTDHRWLCLTVRYVGEKTPVYYEMTWEPGMRAVVLTAVSREDIVESGTPAFSKGTVLAAKIQSKPKAGVPVYVTGSGYYLRLLPVLAECKRRFGLPDTAPDFSIGEDISMYDMVGCASPGWSDKYDIPRSSIAARCVGEKDYVLRQLLQSRPAVLLLVSTSALEMFTQSFADKGGHLTFSAENRDVYDLLKETCLRCHYFIYENGDVSYRARVIVTPHFSYAENFVPHARFSRDAWKGFCTEFPCDAQVLESGGRIGQVTRNDMVPIGIRKDDPIESKLGCAAWQILISRFYDPYGLIADALSDEYRKGTLVIDSPSGHLQRTNGPCAFCKNSTWHFPEGCPYGKC
ncbi:MAG: hypothetical protein LKE40_07405 [Spirochaetia bacterium]|jgi:hypothetical protein|nr:hypothetical protein [Spirochaetia bacterium]